MRKTMFVPLGNLQHVVLRASPDQQLLGLGTVRMEVPGASARAIDLVRPRAEQQFARLTERMLEAAPASGSF